MTKTRKKSTSASHNGRAADAGADREAGVASDETTMQPALEEATRKELVERIGDARELAAVLVEPELTRLLDAVGLLVLDGVHGILSSEDESRVRMWSTKVVARYRRKTVFPRQFNVAAKDVPADLVDDLISFLLAARWDRDERAALSDGVSAALRAGLPASPRELRGAGIGEVERRVEHEVLHGSWRATAGALTSSGYAKAVLRAIGWEPKKAATAVSGYLRSRGKARV